MRTAHVTQHAVHLHSRTLYCSSLRPLQPGARSTQLLQKLERPLGSSAPPAPQSETPLHPEQTQPPFPVATLPTAQPRFTAWPHTCPTHPPHSAGADSVLLVGHTEPSPSEGGLPVADSDCTCHMLAVGRLATTQASSSHSLP